MVPSKVHSKVLVDWSMEEEGQSHKILLILFIAHVPHRIWRCLIHAGTPKSSIYRWIFREINHPAILGFCHLRNPSSPHGFFRKSWSPWSMSFSFNVVGRFVCEQQSWEIVLFFFSVLLVAPVHLCVFLLNLNPEKSVNEVPYGWGCVHWIIWINVVKIIWTYECK